MNTLKRISILIVVFSYLFVGDYRLLGVPIFFLVWIYAVMHRIFFQIKFSIREILIQIVATLFFAPLLLRGANLGNQYEISIIYALLFINIFPIILFVFNDVRYRRYFLIVSCLFLILTLFMYSVNIRSLVFGPNIFYRIIGFSYTSFIIMSLRHNNVKPVWILLAYSSTLTTALATQSRGALLLSVLLGLMTFILFLKNYKYKYILIIIFTLFIYESYLNLDKLSKFFGRSAYFDTNNASEAARLDFVSYIIDYYQNLSFKEFLFGLSYPNRYFYLPGEYPHNFFLEIFLSFGAMYFIFYLLVIIFSIYMYRRDQWLTIFLFFPIYFGAMFSGYLGDHAYLLLIPLLIVLSPVRGSIVNLR
ncbi:O-antigen ligase family protein [Psychrobacter sp. ASPA161_6]|uniref:O-antigen ligase family protein n=1 Tax=Psychrobacter sp. ASPA161_6 TaxID=3160962 RepID=UPI003F7F36FB